MLEFSSGDRFIIAQVDFGNHVIGNYQTYFAIDFNDERVMAYGQDNEPAQNTAPHPILIPPFTAVKIYWDSNDNNNDGYCFLYGKLYATRNE